METPDNSDEQKTKQDQGQACSCCGGKSSRWTAIILMLLLLAGLAVWRFTRGGCPLTCGGGNGSCAAPCKSLPAGDTQPTSAQSQPTSNPMSLKAMEQQYRH